MKKELILSKFVPCVPPKATKQQTKIVVYGGHPRLRSADNVKAATSTILSLFKDYAPEQLIDYPCIVAVDFYFPWRKNERKADLERGWAYKTTSPDYDNLYKLFVDSVAPVFFKNDSLIVGMGDGMKVYSAYPGIKLKIFKLDYAIKQESPK